MMGQNNERRRQEKFCMDDAITISIGIVVAIVATTGVACAIWFLKHFFMW